MVKALDSQSMDVVFKIPGWFKVDSAFHPPEVDQMNTRNTWELTGKK